MYKIKYTIPKTRTQRGNSQTITGLTKDEARNWSTWLELRKHGSKHKIIKY